MSGTINMDPALVALARLGQPPSQLAPAGRGEIATTRGDLGHVTIGYRPLDSERDDRALFEATAARVYRVTGGRLAQVLAAPELESLWRTWRDGAFTEFPSRVTLPGPDAPARPSPRPQRPTLAGLVAPPGTAGVSARGR